MPQRTVAGPALPEQRARGRLVLRGTPAAGAGVGAAARVQAVPNTADRRRGRGGAAGAGARDPLH